MKFFKLVLIMRPDTHFKPIFPAAGGKFEKLVTFTVQKHWGGGGSASFLPMMPNGTQLFPF